MEPKPPKAPKTDQGAEIIESILAAAELVLEEAGIAKFTTNRVAERAGVSVGSLYQYFPNKQAVLAELARRLEHRTRARLASALQETGELPLEQVIERVLDVLCGDIGGLAFRQSLLREVPDAWIATTSREVDSDVREQVRAVIASRADTRTGDHATMAWIVAHAIEGLIEAAVRGDPARLADPAFRVELALLATRYLRP